MKICRLQDLEERNSYGNTVKRRRCERPSVWKVAGIEKYSAGGGYRYLVYCRMGSSCSCCSRLKGKVGANAIERSTAHSSTVEGAFILPLNIWKDTSNYMYTLFVFHSRIN